MRVLFDRYGVRVKYWLTFNEINSVLHEPVHQRGDQHAARTSCRRPTCTRPSTTSWWPAPWPPGSPTRWCPDAKVGCMILAMPIYPLTPDPADVVAVDARRPRQPDVRRRARPRLLPRLRAALLPGERHRRWTSPTRIGRSSTNTVDFVSFCYYMSICETADPARTDDRARATSSAGCPTRPCRPASGAGRSTRWACGSCSTSSGTAGRSRCSSSRTAWARKDELVEVDGVQTVLDDYRIDYMNDHLVQVRRGARRRRRRPGLPVVGVRSTWSATAPPR